jgi:hypothetical protein
MRRGDKGDWLTTMTATDVHIDTIARKSTAFDEHIVAKSRACLAPDPTRWEAWPLQDVWLD